MLRESPGGLCASYLEEQTITPSTPYLVDLTLRLAAGLERVPESQRKLHTTYLLAQQADDGGFVGRQGGSDLYYTAFALRSLVMLGGLDEQAAERTASFLQRRLQDQVPIVDLLSLLYAVRLLEASTGIDPLAEAAEGWPEAVAAALQPLRRDDGGFAKSAEGHASSTYHTFLVAIAYQLLEQPLPQPERAAEFVLSQQRDDGGFVEIRVMRRSGTNPTAAAVGTLRVLQPHLSQSPFTPAFTERVSAFLVDRQSAEGGMQANTQIPIADLLSTFTGLQTLHDLGQVAQIDADSARQYVGSLELATGGFRAAVWDEVPDVEYTFYGLGVMSLLLA